MATREQSFDAIIIGAGPAGVSCAVWLARLGLSPLLLEASAQIGGLCRLNPFRDDWNAALPGLTGEQVADNLAQALAQAQVPLRLSWRVEEIRQQADSRFAVFEARDHEPPLQAHCVVVATGVKPRSLPSTGGFHPKGRIQVLTGPGRHVVAQDFRGKRVAVLGGGDNAFENALYAVDRGAACVHVYARSIRAGRQLLRQIPPAQLSVGEYHVDPQAGTVDGRAYDLLMVFYGWEPYVSFADALDLRRNPEGFIATEAATAQTSFDGVYAIGEVAQRQHPCVVTALADGVTAAKAIQARLEAGGS